MAYRNRRQTLRLLGLLIACPALAACGSTNPSSGSSIAPLPTTSAPTATPAPTASTAPSPTLAFVPGTKEAPRVVAVLADDALTFFPNVVTVVEGETVTFKIKNAGKASHEFMLGPAADAFADKEGTPEVADIARGQTKTLTFTFTGPGPYAFACHEPGHFEVGMLG
jgi:plastocyanin